MSRSSQQVHPTSLTLCHLQMSSYSGIHTTHKLQGAHGRYERSAHPCLRYRWFTHRIVCVNTRQVLLISGETQDVHSSKEPCGTSEPETWCPVLSCNVASNLKYRNDLKMPPSLCSILGTFYLLCHLTLLAASSMHSVAFLPSTLQRKQLRSEKSICRS